MFYADQTSPDPPSRLLGQLATLPHVRLKLNFFFALLSALGGIVLASGQGAETIACIAVFAAAFGFVFVDWLRVFHLPPVGAYLAMATAAVYCVYDFLRMHQQGQPEMISVAMLLVLVQGVLMMQPKSRRILEQLAVFCLLELVVAAIFNDAFRFGVLLIPIAILGALSLSLLSVVSLMEDIDLILDRPGPPAPVTRWQKLVHWVLGRESGKRSRNPICSTASPDSVVSLYRSATGWSRYAVWTLTPAIVMIAAAYFYVLPRKVKPSRAAVGGPALVGFDDRIRLEQLGQVMQNSEIAVKVKLTTGATDTPYRLTDSLYLRGKVLEEYQADFSSTRPTAQWISIDSSRGVALTKLPSKAAIGEASAGTGFDDVQVTMTCESMSRPALFAIAPYHTDGRSQEVGHDNERWTLSRKEDDPPFVRMSYGFSTYAFTGGVQTPWIAQLPNKRRSTVVDLRPFLRTFRNRQRQRDYYESLLQYDRRGVPTAAQMAIDIVDAIPQDQRSVSRIAREMEIFLANSPLFQYTLNLNAKPIPNVDPIEQFLSSNRRGHCQYFASALALMLRSVGIPCRVVVGYRTEEFNEIGNYYIARQQHAHAWVEALIAADQMPPNLVVAGQPQVDEYWMRLDPTPGESAADDGNQTGVRGLLDTANNLWEDYVVEMDGERQSEDLVKASGLTRVQSSYRDLFDRLEQSLSSGLSGRQSAGVPFDLAGLLPLLLPLLVFTGIVAAGSLWRYLPSRRSRREAETIGKSNAATPSLPFYSRTLTEMERIGVVRRSDETPDELAFRVGKGFVSLRRLTRAFVAGRYGQRMTLTDAQLGDELAALAAEVDRRIGENAKD